MFFTDELAHPVTLSCCLQPRQASGKPYRLRLIKSITERKIFEAGPEVKKALWGGEFWTDGSYVGTVGEHGNERTIAEYV